MVGSRLLRLALLATLAIALVPAPARAAKAPACRQQVWEVYGSVTDRAGLPVPGARVYVLLDKVSQKEFARQGVRARSTAVNDDGRYHVGLTCGVEPDPCAARPRHLTVIAEARGHASTLRGFALGDLQIVEQAGRCAVRAPTLQLRGNY